MLKKAADVAPGDWVIFKSIMLDGMLARPMRVQSVSPKRIVVARQQYALEPLELRTKSRANIEHVFSGEPTAEAFYRAHTALYRTMRAEVDEARHKFEGSVKLLVASCETEP